MNLKIPQKILLTIAEADAFYKANINSYCPYKLFTQERRIWWVLTKPQMDMQYTVCQDCYYNNRFGKKSVDIKKELSPVFCVNMTVNCDGRIYEECLPLNYNGWNIGIFSLNPIVTPLKTIITYKDNRPIIQAFTNDKHCLYFIKLYSTSIKANIRNIAYLCDNQSSNLNAYDDMNFIDMTLSTYGDINLSFEYDYLKENCHHITLTEESPLLDINVSVLYEPDIMISNTDNNSSENSSGSSPDIDLSSDPVYKYKTLTL